MEEAICKNKWCKAPFKVRDKDIKIVNNKKIIPKQCPKCKSFNDDLSDGVEWEDKEYEGNPWKGVQEIKHNVNYR